MSPPRSSVRDRISDAVLGVPGVRGAYPQQAVATALAVAGSARRATSALIQVEERASSVRVVARIVVERSTPSAEVVGRIRRAVEQALPDRDLEIDVEIAQIE